LIKSGFNLIGNLKELGCEGLTETQKTYLAGSRSTINHFRGDGDGTQRLQGSS